MSDFEGKRGYAVVFLFIPAGLIGGILLGVLGTKLVHAIPRSREASQIRLSLYAGPKDNRSATIDRSLYREANDRLIVTAVAGLYSHSYQRSISFHIEEHIWLSCDLPLPTKPGAADMEWSDLASMREARSIDGEVKVTDVWLRYRVVKTEPAG